MKHVEWVSGFRMFDKSFLRKIPLNDLSNRPFFDGDMLIMSSFVNNNTVSENYLQKIHKQKGLSLLVLGTRTCTRYNKDFFVARSKKYERLFKNPNKFKDDYKIVFKSNLD